MLSNCGRGNSRKKKKKKKKKKKSHVGEGAESTVSKRA
jgi:hypothetical protein